MLLALLVWRVEDLHFEARAKFFYCLEFLIHALAVRSMSNFMMDLVVSFQLFFMIDFLNSKAGITVGC